jgi:cell division protein FtsW
MTYLIREWAAGVRGMLARPLASYYLILGISALLLALGLVMVLSASSVQMLSLGDSPYVVFQKQIIGVAVGLPAMWAASRLPPTAFRVLAYPLMGLAVLGLLLAAIPGVGVELYGASH